MGSIGVGGNWRSTVIFTAALCLLGLGCPALASADLSFCPTGSGPGQCEGPSGVAVDIETGRVWVADTNNNRVDEFAVR